MESDPVVAIAAPRPDFEAALQEFLIGLLAVALRPGNEDAWFELWRTPPSPQQLAAALHALPPAFDLEGDGPRFFQDASDSELSNGEFTPIEQILIDAPGDQTRRQNKDLFVKRDRFQQLGRPAAAMALLTIQTYAPSGGRGNRTSLRGGGPLTTLIDPRPGHGALSLPDVALWRRLWANVETAEQWTARTPTLRNTPSDVFPWLAATRTSEAGSGRSTTPQDAHPLQVYFGLPRRMRLEFAEAGICGLTGRADDRVVTGFRTRPYGVQYVGWRHPLSPYYTSKAGEELLPVHGQPGGVGWRHWIGLTLQAPDEGKPKPAQAVAQFSERGRRLGLVAVRIDAHGYDMDNMKAREWIEATLPVFIVTAEAHRKLLFATATHLTEGTQMASEALCRAISDVLNPGQKDAKKQKGDIAAELWAATGPPFFQAMQRVADDAGASEDAMRTRASFVEALARSAIAIFDHWTRVAEQSPTSLKRVVQARYHLTGTLSGRSKAGRKLYLTFGIPVPEASVTRSGRSRIRKEVRS
jgi:CRISPR system Cascade subunit CasA